MNPGVSCHFLQEILPIQELNPCLLHCGQMLHRQACGYSYLNAHLTTGPGGWGTPGMERGGVNVPWGLFCASLWGLFWDEMNVEVDEL